jgi:hypothetical protein
MWEVPHLCRAIMHHLEEDRAAIGAYQGGFSSDTLSRVAVFTGSFKDPYGIAINAAIVSIPSHKFCNRRFSFDAC